MTHLIVNDPNKEDYVQFHSLVTQQHIQAEFPHFQGRTIEASKKEIEYWVNNREEILPDFLRIIRLTNNGEAQKWDESNSQIVGFIANLKGGSIEQENSGFERLINFAISERFQGKGIMTQGLKMTMQWLKQLGLNISTAFVKPENVASCRVLEKCGFDRVRETPLGITYAKALNIDLMEYRSVFGID